MINSAGASHAGMVRKHNEDVFARDDAAKIWLVADGLGGHNKGEVASELARTTILNAFSSGAKLTDSIQQAHKDITAYTQHQEGCGGMGTTVVAATITNNQYQIAWVGDSRAYIFDGRLTQLTRDHSLVQVLLDRGVISPQEAEHHPEKNVITQSVGDNAVAQLDVGLVTGYLEPGNLLLLCSDGLTGELADREIEAELSACCSIQDKVNRLISLALAAGGRDNISVVVIDYPAPADTANEHRQADHGATKSTSGIGKNVTTYLLILAGILAFIVFTLDKWFSR